MNVPDILAPFLSLNTFPDRQTKEANISSGRFIYSRNVMQFGQNGGFYYARLQLSWL